MDAQRQQLRRRQTYSCFHDCLAPSDATPKPSSSMTHGEGSLTHSRPLHTLKRARSWALQPYSYSNLILSSSLSTPTSLRSRARTGSLVNPAHSESTFHTAAQQSSLSPHILQGIIPLSSLRYEALLTLLLSINIRVLIGNGADALVKVLVKKAVTLTAALILALLIEFIIPILASKGFELELEVRQMVGTISGWVGAQAEEPLGLKLERRIADWLWPPLSSPSPSSSSTPVSKVTGAGAEGKQRTISPASLVVIPPVRVTVMA